MSILLLILQILLALWNIIGGLYTFTNFEQLKSSAAAGLPAGVWMTISVLQVLFAISLLLPLLPKFPAKYIHISAAYLAANSLAGCFLFAQYAGFPGMLWGVIPALLSGLLAYKRKS